MRIGDCYDMAVPSDKVFIQWLIDNQGISFAVNEVGQDALCRDDEGTMYRIVQFSSSRNVARICNP